MIISSCLKLGTQPNSQKSIHLNNNNPIVKTIKSSKLTKFVTKNFQSYLNHNNIQSEFESVTQRISDSEVSMEVERSWSSLAKSLSGIKLDTLVLLVMTSIIIPLFKSLKTSPIVGFLITGTLLGPGGLNFVSDIHMIDILGELGIVFFLFEMGLELSLERLLKMKRVVFGLGTSQYVLTTLFATAVGKLCGLSTAGLFLYLFVI